MFCFCQISIIKENNGVFVLHSYVCNHLPVTQDVVGGKLKPHIIDLSLLWADDLKTTSKLPAAILIE